MSQEMSDRYPIWKERRDPHRVYAAMRRENPVVSLTGPMSGEEFWFTTRYDDCVTVLKHPRIGKEIAKHVPPDELPPFAQQDDDFAIISRHLLNLDAPDHTRLRALVHKAFTPAFIENMRGRVQQIADELIDTALQKNAGEMELGEDYAFPLPTIVIAELLGINPDDRDTFRDWTRTLLFDVDVNNSRMALLQFVGYMNQRIEERLEQPRQDLLSALVSAEESGDKLDRMELMSMLLLLLIAGHETTVNLIGNGMHTLLQHPDQLVLLRDQPQLIRSAVEEMLRYCGPVETPTIRFAFEDVEIGGTVIPCGAIVLPALLAANRDPAQFADPDRFDITRDPNRHIALGNGIHFCLGAPLARMEGAIAVSTLLRRLPNLHADRAMLENVTWNDTIFIRSIRSPLMVQF